MPLVLGRPDCFRRRIPLRWKLLDRFRVALGQETVLELDAVGRSEMAADGKLWVPAACEAKNYSI
jgi:hypothetical protein